MAWSDFRCNLADGTMASITAAELAKLENHEFRRRLLMCNVCFQGEKDVFCRHHEDVLSGWKDGVPLKGRIMVVGVNPQGSESDAVYRQIEQPDAWRMRAQLSDTILDVYADRVDVDPTWGWARDKHPGLRTWLPFVQEKLGVADKATFADHFAFLELIKHTTADEDKLTTACKAHPIEQQCPEWLFEQLRRLEPRMLIVTGNRGKRLVVPRMLRGHQISDGITTVHATSHVVQIGARTVDMYLSIGFSSSARGWWNAVLNDTEASTRHARLLNRIQEEIQQRNRERTGLTNPS